MQATSFYRFQLSKNFPLKKVLEQIGYLKELGVEGVYTSPLFAAMPGSTHGYDITSPERFSDEIGTRGDLAEIKKRGMAILMDLVANHMAASVENPWWRDVLEKGEKSPYARYFDIDFARGEGLVILPSEEALPKKGKYRLIPWQEANRVNYRRFFDICGLAAIRIEREDLFARYHVLTFDLIREGLVDGLRIDHPDGMYDPKEYFDRLQTPFPGLFVVAEKILESEEEIPRDWPVAGTVGYDFLTAVNEVMIDMSSKETLTTLYHDFIGDDYAPDEMLYHQKKAYARDYLTSEMEALTKRLYTLQPLAFTEKELHDAIIALLAAMPVYRTYIGSRDAILKNDDRAVFERAFIEAKQREISLRNPLLFLETVVTLPDPRYLDFLMRFQQLAPPIMAKGLEDTFCYTYNRLTALNEVGGHPLHYGRTLRSFHRALYRRLPRTLNTLSTHDTKRSLDVRCRLAVLSEIPDRFAEKVREWRAMNSPNIDPNTEYLFYQSAIGIWGSGDEISRLQAYMQKAVREGKQRSNWISPDLAYEQKLFDFIDRVLTSPFRNSLADFVAQIDPFGKKNSLSAITLLLGAPGIVDIYQGMEKWDYSLVDPDNRRQPAFSADPSHPKWALLQKGLHLRRAHPDLFLRGRYHPIPVSDRTIAFARICDQEIALFFASRFFTRGPIEGHIELPFEGTNILTGEEVREKIPLTDHAIYFGRIKPPTNTSGS